MPGCSERTRWTPPLSVTPAIVPETRTGLERVTATPGTALPCASVTRTRMEPVCTCAAVGNAATVSRATAESHTLTRFIAFPPGFRLRRTTNWMDQTLHAVRAASTAATSNPFAAGRYTTACVS